MSKFSPGPWRSGRSDMVSYTLQEGEDGGPWKNVYWEHPSPDKHPMTGKPLPMAVARAYGRTEEEALANARLIAAAPELLEELKKEHDHGLGRGTGFPEICRTCALIARIEVGER